MTWETLQKEIERIFNIKVEFLTAKIKSYEPCEFLLEAYKGKSYIKLNVYACDGNELIYELKKVLIVENL